MRVLQGTYVSITLGASTTWSFGRPIHCLRRKTTTFRFGQLGILERQVQFLGEDISKWWFIDRFKKSFQFNPHNIKDLAR
jgi:hypothetical protein